MSEHENDEGLATPAEELDREFDEELTLAAEAQSGRRPNVLLQIGRASCRERV